MLIYFYNFKVIPKSLIFKYIRLCIPIRYNNKKYYRKNSNQRNNKKLSANFSNRISCLAFSVLIEKKDNREEMVSNKAITEVNSSTRLFFVLSVIWSEVITKRQNPSKLADVLRICCEVLLANLLEFKSSKGNLNLKKLIDIK